MLELRYVRVWRGLSLALLMFVLAATLMPAIWFWSDRVRLSSWVGGIDKWAHFFAFLFLAMWFSGLYRVRNYWRVALGLLAFGILIELCQRAVGYRSAEWMDVVADALGILVGLSLGWLGLGGWCRGFEAWWLRRREPSP
ncbi:MAG: VanZ family protein [Pseudomonadota bacterium]